MGKISNETRYLYTEKIKAYKERIDGILAREKNLNDVIMKDPNGAAFKRLILSDEMLNLASNYLVLNGMSVAMLGVKSEDALNEARKGIYKSIIYLEDIVSGAIDVPFSDYEDKLAEIVNFDGQRRYGLVRKLGLAIRLLEDAYGENTKWRWSFVELEGRFAAVTKNLFDMKSAVVNLDPRSPEYETTTYYSRIMKRLLSQSADRYRERYELSTNRIDDFKLAISFLGSLRRIHVLLGERDEAETVKKKMDIWTTKLDADQKKKVDPLKKA